MESSTVSWQRRRNGTCLLIVAEKLKHILHHTHLTMAPASR